MALNKMNAQQDLNGPGTHLRNYAPVTYTYRFTVGNDGNIAYGYKEPNSYDGEPGYGSGPAGDADKLFGLLLFRVLNFPTRKDRWDKVSIGFSDYSDKSKPTHMVKECKITFLGKRSMTLAVNAKAEGDNKYRMLFSRDNADLLTSYIVSMDGKEVEMTVTIVNATDADSDESTGPVVVNASNPSNKASESKKTKGESKSPKKENKASE
jgi:hypothetical protein